MYLEMDSETPFNLDHTLQCGQVFRWSRVGNSWRGIVGRNVVNVEEKGDHLFFSSFPEKIEIAVLRRIFRLDDDLFSILTSINKDATIDKAIGELPGLRLVRQDPWECLISFLCATYANIPRIRGMIENLAERFGERVVCEEGVFYTFPSREDLAKATLLELKSCGLGFRAKYVLETVKKLGEGFNLYALTSESYENAKEKLLTLKGVGPKVADCILLFSLDKLESFPVDVWIDRIVSKYYTQYLGFFASSTRSRRINSFGRAYFGEYAGYAQEYLYHYYKQDTR